MSNLRVAVLKKFFFRETQHQGRGHAPRGGPWPSLQGAERRRGPAGHQGGASARTSGGGVGIPPDQQAKPIQPPPRRSPRPQWAEEPRDSVDHFAKPSQPLPRPLSLATAGKEEARNGRKGSRQAEVRRHHSPAGQKPKPKSQSPRDGTVREAHKVRAGTRKGFKPTMRESIGQGGLHRAHYVRAGREPTIIS